MKTKLNDFLNENRSEGARKWLLEQPYIIEDQRTKELKVVGVRYKNFPESLLSVNKRVYDVLKYDTMFRYLLFAWLHMYKGANEILVKMKREISKPRKDEAFTRPFTQIPTNFTVLNTIKPIVGKSATIQSTDTIIIGTLLAKKDDIFTETNVIKWYNKVAGLTKRADDGEERTIEFIKKNNIFSNPTAASGFDDKSGIDIWAYSGEKKVGIQVKEPSKSTDINMYWSKQVKDKYVVVIKKTNLEIHNYFKGSDGDLPWKFLYLWDHKKSKLYSINSHSITSINKDTNNNIWIQLSLNDEWLQKMIKIYDN